METRRIVLLACLALPALMALATIWIQIQNRRIRSWKEAAGRIVSSKATAREVRSTRMHTTGSKDDTDFVTDETIETRNFAEISYTFAAGAHTYQGNRIGLSADPGNFEVAETLKRYPEGKSVTVIYNPLNPNECILERDDPANIRNAWLAIVVLFVLIVAGYVVATEGVNWLGGMFTLPKVTPLAVALGIFALVMMLFARMLGRQTRAMRAWPTVDGQITRSEVETTVQQHNRANPGRRGYDVTMYVPRLVYSYQVGGNSFEGDNSGWSGSASTPSYAEKAIKRYAPQTMVKVFYNPLDPTQSTLKPAGRTFALVLWLLAAGLAIASFAAGRFL